MARRKKPDRSISKPTPRSVPDRHRLRPVELVKRVEPVRPRPRPDLKPIEDLRTVPHDYRPSRFSTISGRRARIETRTSDKVPGSRLPEQVHTYFRDPGRVLVCIRRESRKRVLFALQKIGRGKKVSKFHRFTDKSYVRCK